MEVQSQHSELTSFLSQDSESVRVNLKVLPSISTKQKPVYHALSIANKNQMTPEHFIQTFKHLIPNSEATVWLHPNHRLISLDVIEDGDLLVCGRNSEVDLGMMGCELDSE